MAANQNHRLLGRMVQLKPELKTASVEITGHMKDGGTIECVRYDKDSRYSPYWVLVRNPTGATMEIGLAFLTIDEVQDGKA